MSGFDGYVKSLLHFDGANGSTTFTDESGKSWTASGAVISTAQSVFGGASGYFDRSDDYIYTADADDWDVGSGDFTIDLRIRTSTEAYRMAVFSQMSSDGATATQCYQLFVNSNATTGDNKGISAQLWTGTTRYAVTVADAIAQNTWYHIGLERYGNTFRLFKDGASIGSVDVTGVTVNNPANPFVIGRWGSYNSLYYGGHIEEFRFSKGVARYLGSDFTPPTSPYSRDVLGAIIF